MRAVAFAVLLASCGGERPPNAGAERTTSDLSANPFSEPIEFLHELASVGECSSEVTTSARMRWRVTPLGEAPFDVLSLRGHAGIRDRFEVRNALAESIDPALLGIGGRPEQGVPLRDVARALSEAIHARVEQRRVVADQPPEFTWRRASGDCTEMADLLAAALRGFGVSARVVGGVAAIDGQLRYHAWVEYSDGGAWVGIDPTLDIFPLHPGFVALDHAPNSERLDRLETLIGRIEITAVD